MRVRVGPGATALTRTPRGPYSAAQAFVNSSRAARLAPYKGHSGLSEAGDHRGDVDNRTPPAFGHGRCECRDEEERHFDVQTERLVELCFGRCVRRSEQGDASVVDEN